MVAVANDARSYLISITVAASAPELPARLANALAIEYLNTRTLQRLRDNEGAARTTLSELLTTYGDRFPSVMQAKAALGIAQARLKEHELASSDDANLLIAPPGQSLTWAEPIGIPASPNPVSHLGIELVGSLIAGVAAVILLERRDQGFRGELAVPAATGIPCVGIIPRREDDASSDRRMERREAIRSLCLSIGLTGAIERPMVVMITSAVPRHSKSDFIRKLASALADDGQRVLLIDASASSHSGSATTLDDVLGDPERMQEFIDEQSEQSISELSRVSGLNGLLRARSVLATRLRRVGNERVDVLTWKRLETHGDLPLRPALAQSGLAMQTSRRCAPPEKSLTCSTRSKSVPSAH